MGGNPQIQRFREDATRAPGSPFRHFGEAEWTWLMIEGQNWRLSQFMHGEQGAYCTAKIVETVPWIDAKYYARPRSWTRPATSRSSPATST